MTPTTRPQLSLGVLAYNERETIEEAAERSSRVLQGLGISYELLLVDDGSTDGTREVIVRLAGSLPNGRAILHPTNRGIAAGVRSCYFGSAGEWATWFPADLQADPAQLPELLPLLEDCDVLLTYRDAEVRAVSGLRRSVSAFDRWLVRALFGLALRDLHWIRFFRRGILDGMQPVCRTATIDTEMVLRARAAGARLREAALPDRPRERGTAKALTAANAIRAASELLALRLRGVS